DGIRDRNVTGVQTCALPISFLSCCRQGICFIPLILVLPNVWGLAGVQYCQPIADVLSFVVAVPFMAQFLAELDRMDARVRAGQQIGRASCRVRVWVSAVCVS